MIPNLKISPATTADTLRTHEYLRRVLLACTCFAILVFFFSPSWLAFYLGFHVPEMPLQVDARRGMSVLWQIDHLGAAIPDGRHAVIQWRLLFPMIGHLLDLPRPAFFALSPLGCFAVLLAVVALLRRSGQQWLETALGAIVLGATSWCFVSTGWLGYFDSWMVFALLLVGFARRPWLIWLPCLLGPWVDERFVIAAPLTLLCRWLYRQDHARPETPAFSSQNELIIPAVLIAGFIAIRLGLLPYFSAATATPWGYLATQHNLSVPVGRILFGVWEGLRVAWLFVGIAIILLHRHPLRLSLLVAGTFSVIVVGLFTAQDFSRSMTMIWPLALYGLIRFAEVAPAWNRWTLSLGAAGALLLPAHHVMSDRVNQIYYLHHELALLESPPEGATPSLWELIGIQAIEHGNPAEAEVALSVAVKLSDNPAHLHRRRGMLRARQGQWAEAHQDFTKMTEYEPNSPDSWFLLARSEFALGHETSAQTKMKHSLELAPIDFAQRRDVSKFLAELHTKTGGTDARKDNGALDSTRP